MTTYKLTGTRNRGRQLKRRVSDNLDWSWSTHEGVSKSFRTESVTKYTLTTINNRWEATQRVMAAELTRLTHEIAIQLHLEAESCTICSSRSRRPVRKLSDTLSYSKTPEHLDSDSFYTNWRKWLHPWVVFSYLRQLNSCLGLSVWQFMQDLCCTKWIPGRFVSEYFSFRITFIKSRDNSVGIATRLRAGRSEL
jgi:hypothetical protein